MRTYLVGGAVRDRLSGITPKDRDFVVLESSANEMQACGFLRVGASYEVFIHPQTKEEYVLADNLEADLKRRDLTINSMALDEKGELIDPFGGKSDLEKKILRHTSSHFSEDPLRVYRLARFRSQWPEFQIAQETLEVARQLVKTRGFKNLHGNRIFNELRLALEVISPSVFFETLELLLARQVHFGKVRKWKHLDEVKRDAEFRFAALAMGMCKDDIELFCDNLFVPRDWKLKAKAASLTRKMLAIERPSAEEIVDFFYEIDCFRRPDLLSFLWQLFGEKFDFLRDGFLKVKDISLINSELSGKEIGLEIKHQRCLLLGIKDDGN